MIGAEISLKNRQIINENHKISTNSEISKFKKKIIAFRESYVIKQLLHLNMINMEKKL
jgi:hypothetical protein